MGVLKVLVLLWGARHGSAHVFFVARTVWLLLSAVVPACVILMYALCLKARPAGPPGGPGLLKMLVVRSAA
ncbi:hypothetical protein CLM74_03140 [Stenotrophomonas sp. MYb57]|nr:hypothetical protein CLM74_03140 [Stenotrophomonas sp. MYb57]